MLSERVYEVYSYYKGRSFDTLWLCKSQETAEFMKAWEEAAQFEYYCNAYPMVKDWSWETWLEWSSEHAAQFYIQVVDLYN